ncbi:ERBB receptor feedback inhibitor 1a [Anguilla rostrata]|uniref:ERBB receptor feedback inhibitor 1a n=1 Tax=Anguilla anguilla TaxID=7936 RepID=A0A9D3RQI4_ANGAN|nr:ERBB receptor feedback inhibitor 1a [Anguilla anguilla]XP_035245346.1 ERBB receptor feedback inhibitor 1a [Anguilla anguilla]KAG5836067.1 hypothetical protein ANANG_G00250670 [Anguilla anguilla]
MRLDCSWSMSTAGLTAQDLFLPPEKPALHGRCFHSMANDTPSWSPSPDLDRSYIGLDATSLEQNHRTHQQVPASERQYSHPHSPVAQRLPPKKSRPSQLSLSSCPEPSTPSPSGDDQVVPPFQRLSVYERSPPHTPSRALSRGSRPLPPLPGPVELTRDRPVEDEAEVFSGADDSRRLVPEPCPKLPALRPGDLARRSFRGCGRVNYAYLEGPCGAHAPVQHKEDRQPQEQATPPSRDRAHRRLRRSHSGPTLRQPCLRHASLSQDKPQVPPRIPIPPRTFKTTDLDRRWSTEVSSGGYSDEDRPPKVPPRDPMSSSPQTPSPKSIPTYPNGVMPPTKSFAPDPNYVSRALRRQHSEGSPCILPVMEQGRKASHTHYFLLPQRPAYLDRLERFLRGAECEQSGSDWNSRPHTDLV